MSNKTLIAALVTLLALAPVVPALASDDEAAELEASRQAYEQALQAAEQHRRAAEEAMQQANRRMQEASRSMAERETENREFERQKSEELRRMREELRGAHRELRQAQREIARVHRDLELAEGQRSRYAVRFPAERAVIGIVLGSDEQDGVQVLGVSPDGPADRAGVRQGDVIIGINDQPLAEAADAGTPRTALHQVMGQISAGDSVRLSVLRGDEELDFEMSAERRAPLVWEGLAPLAPLAPPVALPPDAPNVLIERIEMPEIDTEAFERHVRAVTEEVERLEFVAPRVTVDVDSDGYTYAISSLGDEALREANLWFGLPHSSGLRLAELNPELGAYFNAESGVLVLNARDDNPFDLETGDVIEAINGERVSEPADVFRALRAHAPGDALTFDIRRRQQAQIIDTVVPEHPLGSLGLAPDVRIGSLVVHREPAPDAE